MAEELSEKEASIILDNILLKTRDFDSVTCYYSPGIKYKGSKICVMDFCREFDPRSDFLLVGDLLFLGVSMILLDLNPTVFNMNKNKIETVIDDYKIEFSSETNWELLITDQYTKTESLIDVACRTKKELFIIITDVLKRLNEIRRKKEYLDRIDEYMGRNGFIIFNRIFHHRHDTEEEKFLSIYNGPRFGKPDSEIFMKTGGFAIEGENRNNIGEIVLNISIDRLNERMTRKIIRSLNRVLRGIKYERYIVDKY